MLDSLLYLLFLIYHWKFSIIYNIFPNITYILKYKPYKLINCIILDSSAYIVILLYVPQRFYNHSAIQISMQKLLIHKCCKFKNIAYSSMINKYVPNVECSKY